MLPLTSIYPETYTPQCIPNPGFQPWGSGSGPRRDDDDPPTQGFSPGVSGSSPRRDETPNPGLKPWARGPRPKGFSHIPKIMNVVEAFLEIKPYV